MHGRDVVESRVPRGTFERLFAYVDLLSVEAANQNLVSAATLSTVWERHILDSLQLLDLAKAEGTWADIGSGAGLPGLIVAIASHSTVTLIEPRKRRVDFLARVVEVLDLTNVRIISQRCETARLDHPAYVSARAVAPLDMLFAMAAHFTSCATCWILPKGRSAADEVAIARRSWQGEFRLVPSLTEPGSSIVVAHDIRRRGHA